MNIYAFDNIALDFALTAGFADIFIARPNNKNIHKSHNPSGIACYLLNYDIQTSKKYYQVNKDNLGDMNYLEDFDLVILPYFLKGQNFYKKIKAPVVFYGTEEKTDILDDNSETLTYEDEAGVIWEYIVSPIQSYEYFINCLKEAKIKFEISFEYTKNKYNKMIARFKKKWEHIFHEGLPAINFYTHSHFGNGKIFTYSPGFLGLIYNEIGFKFNSKGLTTKDVTGDGITLMPSEFINHFEDTALFSFLIDYEKNDQIERNKLIDLGKISSKTYVHKMTHDLTYAPHGIIGARYILMVIDNFITEHRNSNHTNTLLRINNALEAKEYYKSIGFLEGWSYIYDGHDLPKYNGKLLRAQLVKFNLEIIIGEINDKKTKRFVSIDVLENQFKPKEVDKFFNALAKDAKEILAPFKETFLNNKYGELIDKYDVFWEIKLKRRNNE